LHRVFLLAVTVLLLAVPKPSAAPEAIANAAHQLSLRIEVYAFLGLHVLTNLTTIDTSSGRYRITTDITTRGIASVFIDLNSHSEVHGRFVGKMPFPEAYRSDVKRNGVDRRYRIDYAAAGPVASEWAPPAVQWETPFPPAKLRGSVDQLTAYFIVERQLAERGSCTLIVPVFDGHSRYDLRFHDTALANAVARGPDGPVPLHVCSVTRDDIPGIKGNHDASEGTYQKGRISYARIGPRGQMVPIRIEYDTEFGAVTGYLDELRGPDGVLHFSE
jgi:Protein of unknown function (DUF3108)